MKLVLTLVVRDEVDVVDAQIAYHLSAGVDFVIATDHQSEDGTTDVLESYARQGLLHRIPEHGPVREADWRTHMARLAATEYGADWVINTDADEFWVPRGGGLKEVLRAVPEEIGVVPALSRHFVPRPDDGRFFAERMTVRVSLPAALNDPVSPYRPHAKVAHRAHAGVTVIHGAHGAVVPGQRSLQGGWYPADVLHFPFRSLEQWQRKGVRRARGDHRLGQYVKALLASEAGDAEQTYAGMVVGDEALERGCAAGSLVVDTRVRDRLRALVVPAGDGQRVGHARYAFPGNGLALLVPAETSPPDESDIADAGALLDADIVRLLRDLDGLRPRLAAIERPRRRSQAL